MSKSKSTTPESPPKFLQNKDDIERQKQEHSHPAYLEVPVTHPKVLEQYALVEEANQVAKDRANALSGMLTLLAPEGVIGYDDAKRCFRVAIPEPEETIDEVAEDSVAGAEEVPQLGATTVDSDKQDEEAGDK